MTTNKATNEALDLRKFTSRKVQGASASPAPLVDVNGAVPDSLAAWMVRYLTLAVVGVRSEAVARKISLHLERFARFYQEAYGHERVSTCLRRDVVAWQRALCEQGLAPATVNNHLASLSAFTTWVHAQAPRLFPVGDPAKGISELGLPPLEPRALSPEQVRSLKNLCDRLERFHQKRGRRWAAGAGRRSRTGSLSVPPVRATGRPWRDRAIVSVLLSTGLRREELVRLDLDQVEPNTPVALRRARRARITRAQGKGKTERTLFLSADARSALADYLERERPRDARDACDVSDTSDSSATAEAGAANAHAGGAPALFLSAMGLSARAADGRLSPRAINLVLAQIGRWHDAELADPARHLSPLRPHDLRHTFAFYLARVTGADAYELERRLGHRSQRYIQRYTNPPEHVAAQYVEGF